MITDGGEHVSSSSLFFTKTIMKENISDILKEEAVSLGLCSQWTEEWLDNETQQSLIDKYKRGFDFCLERDWPSVDYIKSHFDRNVLKDNLIYNDEFIKIDNGSNGVWILNGGCFGEITFRGYSAATIYVRHETKMRIIAMDDAIVNVRVLDNSEVNLVSEVNSKMNAIVYGESASVNAADNIKIRRK